MSSSKLLKDLVIQNVAPNNLVGFGFEMKNLGLFLVIPSKLIDYLLEGVTVLVDHFYFPKSKEKGQLMSLASCQ